MSTENKVTENKVTKNKPAENKPTKQSVLKRMYEMRTQGIELTRRALSKVDANIYVNAEEVFGKWVTAKKEFYKYEKEIKKKNKLKAKKNAAKTQKPAPVVAEEPPVETILFEVPPVLEEQINILEVETPKDVKNNSKEGILNEEFAEEKTSYTALELNCFKKVDSLLTENDIESLNSGNITESLIENIKNTDIFFYNLIHEIFGDDEEFLTRYKNYYIKNNVNISEDTLIDAISEGIQNGDIVVADSFREKFGVEYDAMVERYGSPQDALVSLLKTS